MAEKETIITKMYDLVKYLIPVINRFRLEIQQINISSLKGTSLDFNFLSYNHQIPTGLAAVEINK